MMEESRRVHICTLLPTIALPKPSWSKAPSAWRWTGWLQYQSKDFGVWQMKPSVLPAPSLLQIQRWLMCRRSNNHHSSASASTFASSNLHCPALLCNALSDNLHGWHFLNDRNRDRPHLASGTSWHHEILYSFAIACLLDSVAYLIRLIDLSTPIQELYHHSGTSFPCSYNKCTLMCRNMPNFMSGKKTLR